MCDIFIYIYYELCWRPVRQGVNMAGRIYNTHTLIRIYKYKYNIYIYPFPTHTHVRAHRAPYLRDCMQTTLDYICI